MVPLLSGRETTVETAHCEGQSRWKRRVNNDYLTNMCTCLSFILKKRCAKITYYIASISNNRTIIKNKFYTSR